MATAISTRLKVTCWNTDVVLPCGNVLTVHGKVSVNFNIYEGLEGE
jgi:hypothetical protein